MSRNTAEAALGDTIKRERIFTNDSTSWCFVVRQSRRAGDEKNKEEEIK